MKTSLRPAPSVLLNGSHPIIFVLHQPHITGSFYGKYFMQAETLNDKLLIQPSDPVIEECTTHIVPSLPTDDMALLPAERSQTLFDAPSHIVPSCETHDKDVLNHDIPGKVAVCYGNNCNVNSLKCSSENCQALCKQQCKEVIQLTVINNIEYETGRLHKGGVDGITQEGGDAIVPDINYLAGKSSLNDNNTLNDGITPVLFEAESIAALNTDPITHQDSSGSPPGNRNSHFMQYCFGAQEESDYELELLSPTLEPQLLQQTECSQHSVSTVPVTYDHIRSSHIELVRSSPPQYVIDTSLENIHTLNCSEAADSGSNSVEQTLPVETTKHSNNGHICHIDNVGIKEDDDFKDDPENTLIINSEQQGQQNSNDSGNIFSQNIDDNIVNANQPVYVDQPEYVDDHLVSSIDQSYDDGPSCLFRAMDIVERKESHRPCTAWERILFTGNYFGKQVLLYYTSCIVVQLQYCGIVVDQSPNI